MVKRQIIPWLCLIMSAQAIAFIACQSSTSNHNASEPAIDPNRGELSTDTNLDDNKQSDEQHENRKELVVAVVRDRRGTYGGSDLLKKPPKKSGASSLPVALAHIIFSMCVVVGYLFL